MLILKAEKIHSVYQNKTARNTQTQPIIGNRHTNEPLREICSTANQKCELFKTKKIDQSEVSKISGIMAAARPRSNTRGLPLTIYSQSGKHVMNTLSSLPYLKFHEESENHVEQF